MFNFLKNFSKKKSLFKAKLDYDSFPNFTVIGQNSSITSMEYFTLCLLIYSRIFRYSKKVVHEEIHSVFKEIYGIYKKGLFKVDSIEYNSYKKIFTTYYSSKYSSINIELKENIKENYYYLKTSTPYTSELKSFVFIAFFYIFEKMKKNEENLIEAFLKLGEINLEKSLTLKEATIIPNDLEKHYFSISKFVESENHKKD